MTFDAAPGYLSADDCRLADLIDLVSRKTDLADYPHAGTVEQNVLIYDGARLRKQLSRPACRRRSRRGPLRRRRAERPDLERAGEAGPAGARGVRGLLRERPHRDRVPGLAGARLPGGLAGQRGQSGWRCPGYAPRLPPGIRLRRAGRTVPRARAPALSRAHLAGRGGAHGHARRDLADHVPAALAEVPAGLPGLAHAGVR